MEVIRTIIIPILIIVVILGILMHFYTIREGFDGAWTDNFQNAATMCASNPSGVLVFAINNQSQFFPVCFTSGITNADPVFNNSNPMVRVISKPGIQVNLYSDLNGTGSIVASLPNPKSQIPTVGEFPNLNFKSIKVILPNSTTNTAPDSTGDLPNSYSGLPDVTCPTGSGTSKKTGGICAGPIPNDGTATNPTVVPVVTHDISGSMVDISGVDLSGNPFPNIPLNDLLGMFNISTTTNTTTTTPVPVADASVATTAAPPISLDTIKSMIRREVQNELDEEDNCGCQETPSIQQGCNVQKKKIDLSMNTQKDSIPCWGC